jgi:uncharacterized membrane protein
MPSVSASPSKIHETNIEKVVRLEAEAERQLTAPLRYFGAVGRFAGTPAFIVVHLLLVGLWMLVNGGFLPGLHAFDPFPFVFLGVLLAIEAVLLASFILIRQNRMSMLADRRSHLDLQINLLAEKEVTKVIQILQRMSRHMGIEDQVADRETRELGRDTEVEQVAEELAANLDEGSRGDKPPQG